MEERGRAQCACVRSNRGRPESLGCPVRGASEGSDDERLLTSASDLLFALYSWHPTPCTTAKEPQQPDSTIHTCLAPLTPTNSLNRLVAFSARRLLAASSARALRCESGRTPNLALLSSTPPPSISSAAATMAVKAAAVSPPRGTAAGGQRRAATTVPPLLSLPRRHGAIAPPAASNPLLPASRRLRAVPEVRGRFLGRARKGWGRRGGRLCNLPLALAAVGRRRRHVARAAARLERRNPCSAAHWALSPILHNAHTQNAGRRPPSAVVCRRR